MTLLSGYVVVQPELRRSAILSIQTGDNHLALSPFIAHWQDMLGRTLMYPSPIVNLPIQTGMDDYQMLEAINNFISYDNFEYMHDDKQYNTTEYWASPYEFFTNKKGDCEDFAIAKYFVLRNLGVPADYLYIGIARYKNTPWWDRVGHAVLVVKFKGQFLILDNAVDYIYNKKSADKFMEFEMLINENSYEIL